MIRFIFFDLTFSICRDGVKRVFLVRLGFLQPYLEQLPGGGGKVVEGALPLLCVLRSLFWNMLVMTMAHLMERGAAIPGLDELCAALYHSRSFFSDKEHPWI